MPTHTAAPVRLLSVSARRGDDEVLSGVDAVFVPGAVSAVSGPNGSGKSTLLEVIAGVHPLTGGSREGIESGDVAFVPQRSDVSPHLPLTVGEAVAMGRWRIRGAWRPLRRSDRRSVDAMLDLLGLDGLRTRPLGALSGGQRQRTFVAQGLVADAPILVLDEPTAGVDAASARIIGSALRMHADAGAVVIQATHDSGALAGADSVLRLEGGRVVDPGTSSSTTR